MCNIFIINQMNVHKTIVSRLLDTSTRIEECKGKADAMVESKHFYSEKIKERLEMVGRKHQQVQYDVR